MPGSDHNLLDADHGGYPYEDDGWRGRDDVRWCFTVRTAKHQKTAKVPKYAEQAWVGQDGKWVPASMRDTIVAYWPASPIDSPRDLVGKALELLGHGMLPRMQDVFEPLYGDNWHYELRQEHWIFASDDRVPLHDPYVYFNVLLTDAEVETFEKVFTVTTRANLEHVRDARDH